MVQIIENFLRKRERTWPWFNIKMTSYQHRKSHCGDKTILRPLISTMGFPILVRWHLYIESGPCLSCTASTMVHAWLLMFWWSWWCHQMETFSALLAICVGNSPVPGEFPTQRPVTRSFVIFFDLHLNKQLSKQWWGWWFEMLSRPLWWHRNDAGSMPWAAMLLQTLPNLPVLRCFLIKDK